MATENQSKGRNLVSNENYEVEYIHKQFPQSTHEQVVQALAACKNQVKDSKDRSEILECLKSKLKITAENPDFKRQMSAAESIINRYRDTLRELAK